MIFWIVCLFRIHTFVTTILAVKIPVINVIFWYAFSIVACELIFTAAYYRKVYNITFMWEFTFLLHIIILLLRWNFFNNYKPGHALVLQDCPWVAVPTHGTTPFEDVAILVLFRDCCPPPHDFEHVVQSTQFNHSHSAVKVFIIN